MSTYVNVSAEDLNIGDLVKGKGRLARDVTEHDTLEGFLVAVFERRGEERIVLIQSDATFQVRCADDY